MGWDGMMLFVGQYAGENFQSAPQHTKYIGPYLEQLYANAHSMRSKEELEALAVSQSYDITGTSETPQLSVFLIESRPGEKDLSTLLGEKLNMN